MALSLRLVGLKFCPTGKNRLVKFFVYFVRWKKENEKFTFYSIMMNAECLPTEIWLEIFSYLHPLDNVRAFLKLNQFFNRFASTKYFGLRLSVRHTEFIRNGSKSASARLRLHVIRSIADQRHIPNKLLEFLHSNADYLVQLRKIYLYLRRPTMIQASEDLIDVLNRLSSLRSMEIRLQVPQLDDWQMKDLLVTVFSKDLPLIYCHLLFSFENLYLPPYQWSGPSSIRYLTIGKISWANLLAILFQTRNLVYLNVTIFASRCQSAKFTLPSLEKIVLKIDKTPFVLLTNICQLAPQLNHLSLRGSFPIDNEDYFQNNFWNKVLDPIPFHLVFLEHSTWLEEEKLLLEAIYDSLVQKQWLRIRRAGSFLRVRILFRSK